MRLGAEMRTEGEALNTGLTRARGSNRGRRAVTWAAILAVLVTVLVLVLPAAGALAAVTLEGPPTVYPVATAGSSPWTISFTHTTGIGSNRLLLVGVSYNSNTAAATISSVTFTPSGGSALTLTQKISQKHSVTANYRYAAIWYLAGGSVPSGATGTVAITFSGAVASGIVAGAANFAGVDSATPLGSAVGASSPSNNTLVTVPLTGLTGNELVFDTVFLGGNPPVALTVDSSQTQLTGWNTVGGTNTRGAASTEQATGASVTMSWSAASSSLWVTAAVPIKPAPTNNPTVTINQAPLLRRTPPLQALSTSPPCSTR